MDNFTKISGWVLVLAGLSVIVFTIWSSYNMFLGKTAVPEFFPVPQEEEKTSSVSGDQTQALVEQAIKDQLKGALPPGFVAKLLNLSAWAIVAMILMSGGSRISDLGTKLIRTGSVKNEYAQG